MVLYFPEGNKRVVNLVTILNLVQLKWLVVTHSTAMATEIFFFFEHVMRTIFLAHNSSEEKMSRIRNEILRGVEIPGQQS